MSVTHVLKDGKAVKSIDGHVVRMQDAQAVYELMSKINRGVDYAKD